MTDRDKAIQCMNEGRFKEALDLFERLIDKELDAGLLYMAGQCCRFAGNINKAIIYLKKAVDIENSEPAFFLALGIALQIAEQYDDAITALTKAIELDADYDLAYNSLALTQKKIGKLQDAVESYDGAAIALSRKIVKNMTNAAGNKIYKHIDLPHDLWTKYALHGAMVRVAIDKIDSMALPKGEFAAEEERTQMHGGLYWVDLSDSNKKDTLAFA